MTDVNANIGINFDTNQALAQLRQLQAGLSRFNQSLTQGNVAAMNAQKGLNDQLMQAINATGKFVATQKDIATSTSSFTQALEKNQLSMREYFRYTAAAATANTKVFKNMFAQERDTLNRARKDRVKLLQSQYIQMQSANGDMIKVLQVIPKHLKMVNGQYADYATRMQMAAQRQQFLNQLLKQGSTQLLNFGKNTQWAGRQLMVGLTIPLSILGSTAAKTFMEMEQAVLKFTRVYGDMLTGSDATDKAIADIQRLGKEFTKYGIAVKDTVEMAASAAAMGLTGDALTAQVTNATKLSVLGQVEQQQALETTISLTNAFGIASEDLAKKINFLNAVENQTVLSIEDLTIAIPKAGPVVKQLGGSVEDLAFFMTAMKEGGINASEGANALKSGLASIINPSKKASEFLASFGINVKGLVDANKGDLKGTVVGFARALDQLDPLNRARAIEQMFGKFQFARLSTLFQNITKDSSQAARALGLAGASVEELAILSERELKKVEDSTGAKFKKAMENIKTQLVPIGKAFLEAVTPIVSFVGKILEKFNNLSEGTKKVVTIIIGVIGGLAPIALMTFGILANGVANLIKFFAMLRGGIAKLNGANNVLGGGFDYLTNQQIENLAESKALHSSHNDLISTFNVEKSAVDSLAAAYGNASNQARALAQSSPGLFNTVPGPAGAVAGLPPKKFATGGVVPGSGNKDTVPALLTPGEVVITKQTAKENPELVAALQNGSVQRYAGGTGRQSNPGKTGFKIGGETFGLAISPKSDKVVEQVEKLAAAMQDGSLNVEQGADILKEVFARLADDSRVTITEFIQELRIATKEISGVELTPAQINEAAGAVGANAKIAGHSASEAGVSKNVRDQMTDAGRKAEFDRLQKIANETADRLESERPDLPRLQRPDKKNVQIDRGHIGAVGTTEKGLQEGWDPDLWDLSTHAENEMAQTLASNNEARRVYLEKLRASSATEEEILSITEKINTNGALNERELQVQKEVLSGMLADKDFMASEQKKAGKGKPMSIEKTMLATIYDAEGRAANPVTSIDGIDDRTIADRLRSGRDKIKRRFGKNNAPGVGADAGFVPLSDAERQARLDSIKISEGVDADLTAAEKKAETASPSKRTKRLGKDIADGLALGLEEGKAGVKAKSSQLTDAALPTAAETQSRIDKMDLTNKAFYDDLDTPELRDQRQILKSQDRQRRKLGATTTVDSVAETPVASQTSILIASSKKAADAAENLAVKTEEAVQAETQVVQQIKDESKNRTTIKGNTINIGRAKDEAEKASNEALAAEKEAADIRKKAAALEEEQAKQSQSKSPTSITDEQVQEAREKANEAELRAAHLRIAAAEKQAEAVAISRENGSDGSIEGEVERTKQEELVANGTVKQGDLLRRTADSSEDTVDSTVMVAEQTDELASVTQDAVDAQTDNATNLLTGAQITDATTGNLGEVLQATDQTGLAQQEIADSSDNIANINDQIEREKKKELDRLRKYNTEQAAIAAADGQIIPPGSQSSNGYINPATAMGSVEAYEEASTYTRNKKGQILFDPETGQPTTLTAKQIAQKKRGMRREKVGKYSGKISGGLGTAAMVAGMVGAPPQVTAALGTAATVAQFAPMIAGLSGPQGVVVAIAALAAGAYLLNRHFNKMAAAAAKFATDLSATREGLKAIGEVSGKVGASEIMDKRRQSSQYGKYDESIKIDNTFGKQFLGSDVGKKEKKLFQENVKQFGNEKAISDLSLKLSMAVADGVLDSNAANSIAAQLALELKDQKIEMQVVGQLSAMLGPDGKNLKDNPIETRALIMANANMRTNKVETDIAEGVGSDRKNVATVAAYNMNNIQMATMMADQVQIEYETQKKKLEAEMASTTNAAKKLEIGKQIAALDAQNVANTKAMNAQILSQISLQQKSFDKVYSNSLFSNKEDAYFDASRAQLETNYKGTDQEEAAKKFLNKTEALDNNKLTNGLGTDEKAQKFQAKWEMLVGSKVLSPSEASSYMDLFAGRLPELDLFINASIQTHGTSKTKELLNMFAGYKQKGKAIAMVTKIALTKQQPAEFDAMMEALKGIQALDGSTIDMEVLVSTIGLEGLEVLKGQMENIEKLKEEAAKKGQKQMDLEAAKKINPAQAAAIEALKQNVERKKQFDALSLEGQAEYLQKLATQYANEGMLNEKQRAAAAETYAIQQAYMLQATAGFAIGSAEYLAAVEKFKTQFLSLSAAGQAVLKLSPVGMGGVTSLGAAAAPAGGGGAKDNPLDFLDALAMRIKMVRDQAFNARKPVESMLAAFNSPAAKKNVANMFKMFDGLQQKLIALKVPKEFRDYIASLSAEDFEKLRKADLDKKAKGQQTFFEYGAKRDKNGKIVKDKKGNIVYDMSKIVGISKPGDAIMAAYNEAPLDNFNIAQKEIIANTDNQFKAFNMLKAQGVDTSVALETVADEALAAALASGQLAGTDLKQFVTDLKNAADAAEKAAVMSDLLKKNADFKFKNEAIPGLAAALKQMGLSVENIQTILSDPALSKQFIKDLEDGKIDSKAIADYLNSIKDEKIVEIRGKFNAGDFAGAAAPGMELVNRMFTVQEQLIRTGVSKASAAMVANVKKLKAVNEEYQLLIQEITFSKIRPIEKAIEKAQRDLEINITRKIEDYQEEVNDLQRIIEIAFERPIAAINAENTILSNDMEIMNHAAEEINKRYDAQAEALQKVSEVNAQIAEQEKEKLDLADALSKGDIAAAARAVQSIRAAQSARNAENQAKALEQARQNKLDSLRGRDSGLSKDEITERQYQNAQAIYDLENRATTDVNGKLLTRLQILDQIQKKSDEIYNLEEKREAAQLAIRDKEDEIYKIRQEQIQPLEDTIESNNVKIARDEYEIQKLVDGITVLGKTKDAWDAVAAKIDASSLAGEDFDRLMGSMLASVDKIEEGWSKIDSIFSKYSSAQAAAAGTAMDNMRKSLLEELAMNEKIANEKAAAAKAAQEAAQKEYEIKKAAYEAELKAIEELRKMGDGGLANARLAKLGAAPVAPVFGPSSVVDNANVSYNDPTKNVAQDMYDAALKAGSGPVISSAGGSYVAPGSSGSSGGGAGTVPSPGQKPPASTSGTQTPPAPTPAKIMSMKAPAAPTAAIRKALYSITPVAIVEKRDKAKIEYEKGLLELRQKYSEASKVGGLASLSISETDSNFNAYAANAVGFVSGGTRKAALRTEIDKLKKLRQEYLSTFTSGGKYVSDVRLSDAGLAAAASAKNALPADVKEILDTLTYINASFAADKSGLEVAKTNYLKILKAQGYGNVDSNTWDVSSIKTSDPSAYKAIVTDHDAYKTLRKAMLDKSDQAARARWLLKSAGYAAKDFGWYFGKNPNLLDNTGPNNRYSPGNDYTKWTGYASGGLVSSKFAQNKFRFGTDTVPAMLTPGEFVMSKFAVQSNGLSKLQAMNSGSTVGDSVYNYSISVNVTSDSNPDEIARTVMAQIKNVEAQKMRGIRH